MAAGLMRTALSPNIKERADCSTALCDQGPRALAHDERAGPSGVDAAARPAVLARFPLETLRPGDAFFANDPYIVGVTHLNDCTVRAPMFLDGRLVAFAAAVAHHSDVGGRVPGANPATRRASSRKAFAFRRSKSTRAAAAGGYPGDLPPQLAHAALQRRRPLSQIAPHARRRTVPSFPGATGEIHRESTRCSMRPSVASSRIARAETAHTPRRLAGRERYRRPADPARGDSHGQEDSIELDLIGFVAQLPTARTCR